MISTAIQSSKRVKFFITNICMLNSNVLKKSTRIGFAKLQKKSSNAIQERTVAPVGLQILCYADTDYRGSYSPNIRMLSVYVTCITLIGRPVSFASCSRMWRVGFGVCENAVFRISNCFALIVVRGPLLLDPELPSSGDLFSVCESRVSGSPSKEPANSWQRHLYITLYNYIIHVLALPATNINTEGTEFLRLFRYIKYFGPGNSQENQHKSLLSYKQIHYFLKSGSTIMNRY